MLFPLTNFLAQHLPTALENVLICQKENNSMHHRKHNHLACFSFNPSFKSFLRFHNLLVSQ